MGKKHDFTPKYTDVQAPTAAMNIRQHSRCCYKRDSGSVPAGMNNLHTRRPAGRRTPSASPPPAPTAATTTSVPGGKTAAATASGQTLRRKSSRPQRTRTRHSSQGDGGPGVQAELAISSTEKPSPAATTSALTAASTYPPTSHQRAPGAPKRTGGSSLSSSPREREWDRPRTRVPPSRRTTCCETPRCGWPPSLGQRMECCTLARQQQFTFPGMAGGWFSPPEARGRSGTPAHAKAGPGSPRPPPQQG
jgi:hypothetical protein